VTIAEALPLVALGIANRMSDREDLYGDDESYEYVESDEDHEYGGKPQRPPPQEASASGSTWQDELAPAVPMSLMRSSSDGGSRHFEGASAPREFRERVVRRERQAQMRCQVLSLRRECQELVLLLERPLLMPQGGSFGASRT
jgi:hypothetical protein